MTDSEPKTNSKATWLGVHVPELAGAALAGIIILSVILSGRYLDQTEWVRHGLEVQTTIREFWSSIQDIAINERNFALSGNERYADASEASQRDVSSRLSQLRALTKDNPKQRAVLDALDSLILQLKEFSKQTLAIRRSSGLDAAQASIMTAERTDVANQMKELVERMHGEESALLAERTAATNHTILLLGIAISLGILATLASMVAWIAYTRRATAEIRQSHEMLKSTIADRDAAEEQIRQMQKIEAIGQLTGGIAHDFNNMLAIIMSSIALAQRALARGDRGIDNLLTTATEAVQRASNLVKRLMAFARVQPLAPQTVDANKVVAGLAEMIQRSLGASVEMETILGGGLWLTHVDTAQLENSILNLCVNSRDAMPEGGRLTVETANCHLDERYARKHPGVPSGQYVLLAITDTGTGMPGDIMEKAFDPFFTTKEAGKGTGLGLSQVYGFVKQTGGHIKIYSEIGHGTTIRIYLPRYYPTADARQEAESDEPMEVRGNETILVVDDEPGVLDLTCSSLEELGYRTLRAANHDEAIKVIDDGHCFDLLLTDIIMPVINGRKLADRARTLRPGLRVLFMTGFTRNAIVHHGVLEPGVYFLAKPFSMTELSHKVREALGTKVEPV